MSRKSAIGNAARLRRAIQTLSLLLFLWLLWSTVSPLPETLVPVDAFLRLDPLVSVAVPFGPGTALLALALVAGRLFCGYICPMGITLDAANKAMRALRGRRAGPSAAAPPLPGSAWRGAKYLILVAMLAAAMLGVNLVFWGSPIPLITRFYALLIHPLLLLAGKAGLAVTGPLLAMLDSDALAYAQLNARRFNTLYFVLGFFALLFWLERLRPRFWCRYFCPAGALLALCSIRPLWRRRVHACTACGRCARSCPMGALAASGSCVHAECVACRACVDVCPVHGIRFGILPALPGPAPERAATADAARVTLPSRREVLLAAGSGIVLSGVQLSGVHTLLRQNPTGDIWSEACIRPPGALPEPEFLRRCVRCGQCMKVCPTEAIGKLPITEKLWAKVGTAVVDHGTCIAWAEGKACVVCEEVCPYGAITPTRPEGSLVSAPLVRAERCFGCGYCEHFCPVRVPAIVVKPLNAMRLETPDYERAGKAAGLSISTDHAEESRQPDSLPGGAPPPGFSP
jgi:ferredoxin